MKAKLLKTEEDYNEACERIYNLINSSESAIEVNSSEGEELELLSMLVERYEQLHYSIGALSPIEAIKFRMEHMNLKQVDVAPLFGGKTRVSEVLNGKRQLTLKMIALLNKYLGVPLESLIVQDSKIKLNKDKKEMLLRNPSIREHLRKTSKSVI